MTEAARAEYYVTPEDYLAGERISQQKHEYLAGVIYAMAGTTAGHNRIANNICRSLGNQLVGSPCEVFSSEVKVRIRQDVANFYYYPDATVDCSRVANEALFAEEPRVIFEVMSPDTERIDRGEKLLNYQGIRSLDVYVLVDQFHIAVTVYRRAEEGWAREFLTNQSDTLALPTIKCDLPFSAIYERTHLLRS